MIRLTGMNSGLDTESIIQELSKARQKKVDKVKAEQTKLPWKQEKWNDLNTKISKFYSSLDNLVKSLDVKYVYKDQFEPDPEIVLHKNDYNVNFQNR